MNLIVAMARVALWLTKSRRGIAKQDPDRSRLVTIEASNLDVEAIEVCMHELVRLRRITGISKASEL